MGIKLDAELEGVLQFMERTVQADKLMRVASAVATLAPVLWGDIKPALTDGRLASISPECNHEQLSVATQLHPEQVCAGGDSVAAGGSQRLT